MLEGWSQFLDLLGTNAYFRAGFIWGLVVVAIGWAIWGLCHWLYVQWLKVRQFFEPTRMPGRVPVPVETGPSPATIMLGCVGRIVFTLLVLAAVIGVLLWLVNLPGS
jgi:hypothetical protein